MSFTLHYHKDGKLVPIKMSIWDAFRGSSDIKLASSKGQECPCCGKTHSPIHKTKSHSGEKVAKGSVGNNLNLASSNEEYSAKDNEIILRMKEEGATWAKILEAIGKTSKTKLQAHYKQIRPQPPDDSKSTVQEVEEGGKVEVNSKQNNKQKAELRVDKSTKKDDNKRTERKDEDDKLKTWAAGYDRRKWIAVASKHYDLTGQRISPEMARKLAGAA